MDEQTLRKILKEELSGFASKEDLKNLITKDDAKQFATKEDVKQLATKTDLLHTEERINNKIEYEMKGIAKIINTAGEMLDTKANKKDVAALDKRVTKLESY